MLDQFLCWHSSRVCDISYSFFFFLFSLCHTNDEQLALCMLLLNLYPGKLTTHSNLKYTYTCSFICLNVLEGIKQFYLLMWFKKNRLETLIKVDTVKALIKTSNCENLVLYLSEEVQKIAAFEMLFLVFIDQTIARKWFWLPQ